MVSQVSIDAYDNAIADGRITTARANVLNWILTQSEPVSQADVALALGSSPTDFRRFGPRVHELEEQDVLERCGTKTDPRSGEPVVVYRVTGRPPQPYKAKTSAATLFRKLRDYLGHQPQTSEVQALTNQINRRLRCQAPTLTAAQS